MLMLYKEDWEDVARRFEAWWEGEVIDRVALQVTAPKNGYHGRSYAREPHSEIPSLEPLKDPKRRWTDIEYVIAKNDEYFRSTFWGGEAFPCLWVNLGPDIFAAYLGCELSFAEDTTWSRPFIDSWEPFPRIELDPENAWWRLTKEMTAAAVEAGKGKYFVGITDIHGGGDALAAMRGPDRLCIDLLESPDKIKRAMESLKPIWYTVFEELHEIVQRRMKGSSTWLNVWSPDRMYPLSCDFSCMISPDMFSEFFLPEIIDQANWLDHSIYHLDGPGAIPHLDLLLEMEKLHGIQWVPGAASESMLKWVPLLRRIQRAGKILHLSVISEEVEPLLRELSPEGLMLSTSCDSEEDARQLLEIAVRAVSRRAG